MEYTVGVEAKETQQTESLNEGQKTSPPANRGGALVFVARLLNQRPWIMTLIGVAFLFVYSWALIAYGNLKMEGAWWKSQTQAVDALGAALSNEVYRTDSARLDQILQRIVREGGYRSAAYTTLDGVVVATTDASMKGQKLPELARTSWKARAEGPPTGAVISRKIGLSEDNPRGVLRIALNPRD